MENERIKAIHDAAVHLFLQQGYARTQISHIAREVGVSVGTIYHDFAGKQEIMHFVLKCTISPGYLEKDFERPVTDDLFRGLEEEIMQVFRKSAENFSGRLKQGKEAYDFPSYLMLSICWHNMLWDVCLLRRINSISLCWPGIIVSTGNIFSRQ